MTKIIITGWGKNGPAYDVEERKFDQRKFRNTIQRTPVHVHKGKSTEKPAHAVVEHRGNRWVVLNRGHKYKVLVTNEQVDEWLRVVDAKDYEVLELLDGDVLDWVKIVEEEDSNTTDGVE